MQAPDIGEAVVELRDVSFRVNGRAILSGVGLRVRQGEVLALLGRSGSGKTTVLRLINRLLSESSGEVLVEGRRTHAWDVIALRRNIGYVVQETGLFPHYSVEKNVRLVPELLGKSREEIARRTDEMLRLVGLGPAEFRKRYPHELSGGQRQRVGVARALAADPPILLMDEPFGALDPVSRAEVQQEFKQLQARLQKAVVLVTHDLREALFLGDNIALMDAGRVLALCEREQFLESQDPAVKAYIQAFQANDPFAETRGRQ
jgi:osmoprotectant transport system ATP-binding protein